MTWIAYTDRSRNLENWLILKFFFIHSKTVKVNQDDQIRMWRWFTSVFLMNGTELRSFSHFQILTLEITNMFHYMQKIWNQCGINMESWKFHVNTILWKFQVPHYLCRDRIPTVELEYNFYETENHSIRLWKKCGIIVELTFRRINSTLWNSFGSSLSGVYVWHTVELLWKLSMFHIVSIKWNLLDLPKCKIRNMICSFYKDPKTYH